MACARLTGAFEMGDPLGLRQLMKAPLELVTKGWSESQIAEAR